MREFAIGPQCRSTCSERKRRRSTFAPDVEQVPFVSSKIANRLYTVVNVNTFEGIDPSLVRREGSNFDGGGRRSASFARRTRNWIDSVYIEAGP